MPNTPQIPPKRRIEILAFPHVQILDVTGPLQAFASANDHAAAEERPMPYDLAVVADRGGVVRSSSGLGIVTADIADVGPLDTFIVAGGAGVYPASEDEALVVRVCARAQRARRVASVCSGAFLLAASGLLDGLKVATHWSRCAELARRFPAVRVEPDPIFIREGRIWTSAGITAGIDLALAMIEEDLGREAALAVARQLVVFLKRPGGQSQFSAVLARQTEDRQFEALHGWMADHLDADLSVPALAQQAAMSERSFVRRYRAATGRTPARAVEAMRVEAARRLLEDGRQPVKRVAARCGFGSEESLRRSFARVLNVSPQDYRSRFADPG